MAKVVSSPLASAANKIVSLNRSTSTMRNTQTSYSEFLRFMDIETKNLKSITFDKRKLKKAYGANVTATFGNAGNLLSGLASGALDAGSFIGDFFGRGGKGKTKPRAGKPISRGPKIRLPGVRGLPILSTLFAGLDFAQGISQGESVGKAAAGAGGAAVGAAAGGAAGAALAGMIGQALVPIPGLGFVLGAAVGSVGAMAGGYLADRAYETATGEGTAKSKVESKVKILEAQQRSQAAALGAVTFPDILDKFESVVVNFEKASFGAIPESGSGSSEMEEGFGEKSNEGGQPDSPTAPTEPYDGPISGDTFFPLPRGIVSNRSVGVKGGEYGAPRNYGGHSGQDIGGLPPGSPVVAWKTGKVRYSGSVEPGDTIMTIDHGGGEESVYKHVVPTVPAGAVVYGGQQIAKLFAARAYPEHLHFEIWKNGSHKNPNGAISAAQKISSPLTVEKAKAQSEKSSGKSSVASGATPQSAAGTQQAAAISQTKLMTASTKPTQDLSKMSTDQLKGMLDPTVTGAANPAVFKAAQEARTKGQESGLSGESLEREVLMASIRAKNAETQVMAMSQQTTVPEQIQQYPSYIMPQSSVTLIPILQGNGGSQPMVISSGGGGAGGGGQTVVMSGPSESEVLNSLMKSILLTSLSAT